MHSIGIVQETLNVSYLTQTVNAQPTTDLSPAIVDRGNSNRRIIGF